MDGNETTDATTPGSDADDATVQDRAIERALACIHGVAAAAISRAPDSGAAWLRLRLLPGHDRRSVAEAVAATLEERFSIAIDPAAIWVVGAPAPPLAGAQDLLRAVAEATPASALRHLSVLPFVLEVLEVEHEPNEDLPRMLVAVRLASDRGDEQLLGAAVVRDDPEATVVRATLDAVNRRVEPLLLGEPDPRTDGPA